MTAHLNLSTHAVDNSLFYQIHGNSVLNQAEVVCVVYKPGDQKTQKQNDELIDRLWDEHLVLIEYHPSGLEKMDCKFKRVKKICGWDIPELKPFLDEAGKQEKTLQKIQNIVEDAHNHRRWDHHIKKRSAWESFLSLVRDSIEEFHDQAKALLEGGGDLNEFKRKFYPLCDKVKQMMHLRLEYTFQNTFQSRLASLEQAIETPLKLKQKVIVCLSPDFVVRHPALSGCFEIRNFLAYLKKKNYVIINPKNSKSSIEDQPSLWSPEEDSDDGLICQPPERKQGVAQEETTTCSNEMWSYIWERSSYSPVIKFKINRPHHPTDFPKLPIDLKT